LGIATHKTCKGGTFQMRREKWGSNQTDIIPGGRKREQGKGHRKARNGCSKKGVTTKQETTSAGVRSTAGRDRLVNQNKKEGKCKQKETGEWPFHEYYVTRNRWQMARRPQLKVLSKV